MTDKYHTMQFHAYRMRRLLIVELSRCSIDLARLSAALTTVCSLSGVNGLSSVII